MLDASARRTPRRTFRGLLGLPLSVLSLALLTGLLVTSLPRALRAQPASQQSLPPANRVGLNSSVDFAAITNATVHTAPGKTLKRATVVVKDGKILSVLSTKDGELDPPAPPAGARVYDAEGLHVYAGFIDPCVEVDSPRPDPDLKGSHWSAKVMPQRRALDGRGIDEGTAKQLRAQGFATAVISPRGGIFKGRSAAVSLASPATDPALPRPEAYRDNVYHSVEMEVGGSQGSQGRWPSYPDSQMGAIALIRQTLIDADWLASGASIADRTEQTGGSNPNDAPATAVASLNINAPLMLGADDELEVLRVVKIAREFNRSAIVLGSGLEFRRLDAVVESLKPIVRKNPSDGADQPAIPLVLPLNFPEKPRANTIGEAEDLSLRDLMTWEQAPTNPRRLHAMGVNISLTTAKLKDRSRFLSNLREAVRHGLPEEAALAMITTNPAALTGLSNQLATIEPGKRASLTITDGPLFNKKTKLREVWVDGQRSELSPAQSKLEGTYDLTITPAPSEPGPYTMVIDKDNAITIRRPAPVKADEAKPAEAKPDAKPDAKEAEAKDKPTEPAKADEPAKPEAPAKPEGPKFLTAKARNVQLFDNRVSFIFDSEPLGNPAIVTMSGLIDLPTGVTTINTKQQRNLRMSGQGTRDASERFTWSAVRTGDLPKPDKASAAKPAKSEAKPEAKPDAAAEAKPDTKPEAKAEAKSDKPAADIVTGTWSCTAEVPGVGQPISATLKLKLDGTSVTGSATAPDGTHPITAGTFDPATKALVLTISPSDGRPQARAELTIDGDSITGTVTAAEMKFTLKGERDASTETAKASDEDKDEAPDVPETLPGLPFGPFAITAEARAKATPTVLVITNATIWTSAGDGIIENATLIARNGRIEMVGKAITPPTPPKGEEASWLIIDAKGKHVTPGLIDAHSHTGISRGVNEGGQPVTAEVRIQDVTNPDTVNWYRQLAGGITCVLNLHGSANSIGGQSQVNKLRWGCAHPDDMHVQEAPPGIKFALGENPKSANWSGEGTIYPQTRMGVEAQIRDRFIAAREYARSFAAYDEAVARIKLLKIAPDEQQRRIRELNTPHRDLELDALVEILQGKRLIHCHSYRQDEILMLGRLSQEFGFKLGTYQHILEGYKVADIVRDSSIGASGFSDWWGFKVEVQDAIPQAFPIMHEQGVIVSYNSDSDEMARRMNAEAAKGVKYSLLPDGKRTVTPAEALQWVTINPAKQLKIDHLTGSLEVGKQADIVIWSADPLSAFTHAEQTFVEGVRLFSIDDDKALQEENARTRTRILKKLLKDGPTKKPAAKDAKDAKDSKDSKDAKPAAPGAPAAEPKKPTNQMLASELEAEMRAEGLLNDRGEAMSLGDSAIDSPRAGGRRPLLSAMLKDAEVVARREHYLELIRKGIDPENSRGGQCGCEIYNLIHRR